MQKRTSRKSQQEELPPSNKMTTKSTETILGSILQLDVELTSKMAVCASQEASHGQLRPVMKVLEISCHGVPWIIGAIIMFLCAHTSVEVEIAVNLLIALLADLVVVGVLKAVFRRARPSHNVMDMFAAPSVDKFSFPSGHTTRAAFMALFLNNHILNSPFYKLVVLVWSVSVAFSRLLLGRHHVLDVFFGFLIGVATYYLFVAYLWVPQETCLHYLHDYFSHVHL